MKKYLLGFVFIIFLASQLLGITYLNINGSDEITIVPPADLVINGDFSAVGESLAVKTYIEQNYNGIPDHHELVGFMQIIDGIPSVGDPEEAYIVGDDDTLQNGVFIHYSEMEFDYFPFGMDMITLYFEANDFGDSSSIYATINIVAEMDYEIPEIPYIYGYVISASDSITPIPGAMIISEASEGPSGISDSVGRFAFTVEESGTTMVIAVPLDGTHAMMPSMTYLDPGDDSARVDVYCSSRSSFISGNITLDGSTPVPDFLLITAANETYYDVSATTPNPTTGEYTIPIMSGTCQINIVPEMGIPKGYFPSPTEQTVTVPEGDTIKDIDFDLVPLDAVIIGRITDSTSTDAIIENLPVWANGGPDGLEDMEYLTNNLGYYSIPVKGDSSECYSVNANGYGYWVNPSSYDSLYLNPGDTLENIDFYLADPYAMPLIEGVVLEEGINPIEGVHVFAYNEELSYSGAWHHTLTDTTGRYRFDNLAPWRGTWVIGIFKDEFIGSDPVYYTFEELPEDTIISVADFVITHEAIQEKPSIKPGEMEILGLYPNPFNSTTTLELYLSENQSGVSISLYNIIGRKQKTIFKGDLESGLVNIPINTDNTFHSGVYFIRIKSDNKSLNRTLILTK